MTGQETVTMTALAAFGYGCLGALLLGLVRLGELGGIPKIQRPPTFSDWLWVVQFLGLPLVGGAVAWIYYADGISLKPLLAMHLGLSAPLILKAMAAIAPDKAPTKID
jgi:hypothetical protein